MDLQKLENQLAQLPLLGYFFIDPEKLEFSDRVRWVCRQECPMYGKTWACPPAVGSVAECKCRCLGYENCLMIATVTEISDIGNKEEALATRPGHEEITNQVGALMEAQGVKPYILCGEPRHQPDSGAGRKRHCLPVWWQCGHLGQFAVLLK